MSNRTIIVYSTQTNKRNDIETNVTTWGELQDVLSENGIVYSGMTATENKTKTNLELGAAVLPEGSFTLFLSPNIKIKSGVANWKDMSYNDIRKYATSIGVYGLGTTAEIGQRIENWEKSNVKSSDKILSNKFPTVAAKLDAFIKHVDNALTEITDEGCQYVDYTPFEEDDNSDLATQAAALGL